jgi:uncharacterized protein (DUF1330 family)
MAKAYVICRITVTDPEVYGRYRELSSAAMDQYGGRYLVRGGKSEVLEGDPEEVRLVVIEFDDADAARRWYTSPEYTAAREIRLAAATGSFVLVEGL